jgi:iron transport multicopper oxidase
MLAPVLKTLAFAIVLLRGTHAATVSLDLPIQNKNIAPDGFKRPTTLANGEYPGPLIKGNKGDTFKINVENQLHDLSMLKSTSIVRPI